MPEFKPPSYNPMDRQYHDSMGFEPLGERSVEEPIVPINQIGVTFPEKDPAGRFKSFVQQAQAAIRMGAGTLQLAMNVPHTSPIGGGFKSHGKEVREALREVALANQVKVVGVELPTSSITNMSGFDPQRNRFSDEIRKDHLDEVKDAIKFTAETLGGGGVDIVAFEFDRPINDAEWNQEKKLFRQPSEIETVQIVDTETGGVTAMRKSAVLHLSYNVPTETKDLTIDRDTKLLSPQESAEFEEGGKPLLKKWTWKEFKETADLINKKADELGKPELKVQPETLLIRMSMEGQRKTAIGYAGIHGDQAKKIHELIQKRDAELQRLRQEPEKHAQEIHAKEEEQQKLHIQYTHERSLAEGQYQSVKELEERQKRFHAVSDYATQKTFETYAEAGIAALNESHTKAGHATRPVHVGPEIGWPQFYGSHPDEFIEIILKGRKQMVNLLTKQKKTDAYGRYVDAQGQIVQEEKNAADNLYYRPDMSTSQAEEQARTHIKGVLDTGHLGMWLKHFRPELPWDDRVKAFNSWFTDQAKKLAKVHKEEDIIGGIQVVDTMTGAHAHLPPGQGILPIRETVKILKQNGFDGFIVSEGHEEEQIGEGRILLKAWESLGGHLPTAPQYRPTIGSPVSWSNVHNAYFGKTYSPLFMFGAYAPSNEFKLWSEVPFE